MAGATSRAVSAYYIRNTWLHLLLEVHVFHMYKFYPVIVSIRISALLYDFGVVCSGLWTTVWQTAVNSFTVTWSENFLTLSQIYIYRTNQGNQVTVQTRQASNLHIHRCDSAFASKQNPEWLESHYKHKYILLSSKKACKRYFAW